MLALNNKNELLDLLAEGAFVATPNNRLSAALLQNYFTHKENKTLEKPVCLPYSSLITKIYQRLKYTTPEHNHPLLLNAAQCQYLWQTIIKADSQFTYTEGLLKAVMQAYEQCQQWLITADNLAFDYTPQTKTFQRWWQTFNKRLQEGHLISEHQLIPYLINTNYSLLDKPLIWVCFDEFNPQQMTLQNHLTTQGILQYRYDLKPQTRQTPVLAAQDVKEEYQQLMMWLQQKLNQDCQRIGVVVPNLQQESRFLQRVLQQHFDPSLFDISLGQALSDFPIIAHALSWLNIDGSHINYHQAALLLQSPYLGGAKDEFIGRSQYLQESTLLLDNRISLTALALDLGGLAPKLALLLKKILPFPAKASIQEWIILFQQRLNALGYPGDYGLNSQNYQCFNRFNVVFDEFRQLGVIKEHLTAKEALDSFTHLTENTIFQAQKKSAIIQISGLLEASGCEFDCLWVMGLNDQCLPQKTRLSAFIPPQMQRELFMPHSTPSRELHFARQTLERLQNGSQSTVFSYSKLQGDNPSLPCSLITEYPAFKLLSFSFETANPPPPSFLVSEETYEVPLGAGEKVSGGTALLANQAKCPFKAFAEHRLKAKPALPTVEGLDHREKGQLIHKVMELLWTTLASQHHLIKLNDKDLDQLIEKAINTALTPLKRLHSDSFPHLIQEVEYIRLKRLVLASLEWEKKRPPFSIAALEQSYSINLAGLELKVRVDRLDQVADKKWVIDYKSNLPASKPWNEDRPREPQLLLYALLDEHINTLLLMQLKTGKILYSGLSEERQEIHGISSLKAKETWEDYRTHWQHQLTLLAEEFQKGHCSPQPVNPNVCQQCDFQTLCRFQINS